MVQRPCGVIKGLWKQWARLRHMANVSVPLSWAAGTAEMAAFIRSILHRNPVKVL